MNTKNKSVSGTMLMFLLMDMLMWTLNIQPVEADFPAHAQIRFETFGNGQIEWTNETAHSGNYSAKLVIPQGASTGSWAFVKVSYDNSLETLEGFSFYVKYVNACASFAVYLDKNKDGVTDGLLYSDPLGIGNNTWTLGTGGLSYGWTEATYPPSQYGQVWKPFSYWKQLYPEATVLHVAAVLQYHRVAPAGLGEPLFVDEAIVNGISYELELPSAHSWGGQRQDAAAIPQGGYIGLQADGWDASSLHQAVLSTNETGNWKNETISAVMWNQSAVYGFDNFGTATYKDGVLYAPSKGDDTLYAVNASNGALIWNTTVRQCDGSPCIDGDVVYVGECMGVNPPHPTPQSKAMALNRNNGQVVWQFVEPNGNSWVGSPMVNGQYVYFTTCNFNASDTATNSGVYALNKTNGNVLWHQAIGNIVGSVAYDSGTIFISVYNPAGQYALNATTGQQIWRQSYGSSWDSSPAIYGGMVIQVTEKQGVWSTSVLNETNGQLIRQFEAKGSTGTPLVENGNVFIPSNDWTMWAFNLMTGTKLWQTVPIHNGTLQKHMYCSPASAGGAIYCQALNGTFYVINETDGHILWSYNLGGLGFGSPSVGDGCVFITNDAGLYAFRIGPGSGDWPMFCQNNFHTSSLQHGVEYARWPLTQSQFLGNVSNTWVTARFVWCNKTVAYATIAWKIYFFNSAGNTSATDIMTFQVLPPIGDITHDIAITDITLYRTVVGNRSMTSLDVTVTDQGSVQETFTVIVSYNSTALGAQMVTVGNGSSLKLLFSWNTTEVSLGNYTVTAAVGQLPGETDTSDNSLSSMVQVSILGDINGDWRVDMKDVSKVAAGFQTHPGDTKWTANGDIDENGVIDMKDISTIAKEFGKAG